MSITWVKNAWQFQQDIYKFRRLSKMDIFDKYCPEEMEMFESNLKFIFDNVFGEVKNIKDKEVKKKTEDTIDLVKTNAFIYIKDYNYFTFTFFNLKMEKDVQTRYCVLWFQHKYNGSIKLLDMSARHYDSWDDFMNNNVLPKCYMIYPKDFSYYPYDNFYVDLMIKEKKGDSGLETLAAVGGLLATGVLICNPVTGPVAIGAGILSVASSIYGMKKNIKNINDSEKHDSKEVCMENTLSNGCELVCNSICAISGASGIAKGMTLVKGGMAVKEGSAIYNFAKKIGKLARLSAGIGTATMVVSYIIKYKTTGQFEREDYETFFKHVSLSSLTYIIEEVFQKLIISLQCLDFKAIEYLVTNPKGCMEKYRLPKKFVTSDSVNKLILHLFPNMFEAYTFLFNINNTITLQTNEILHEIANAKSNSNFFEFIKYLFKKLPNFIEEFELLFIKTKREIKDLSEIYEINKNEIETIIDALKSKKSFELTVNEMRINKTLLMIKPNINVLTEDLFGTNSELINYGKKKLWVNILGIIHSDILNNRDLDYIIEKINIYYNEFMKLFSNNLEAYFYKSLCNYTLTVNSLNKNVLNCNNTVNNNLKTNFDNVLKSISSTYLDKKLECQNESPLNNRDNNKIYKFEIAFENVTKQDFINIAKEKVPELKINLTTNTLCNFYKTNDKIVGIINFKCEPVILLFCLSDDNNGILLKIFDFDIEKTLLIKETDDSLPPGFSRLEYNLISEVSGKPPATVKRDQNLRGIVIGDSIVKDVSSKCTSNIYEVLSYPEITIREMEEKVISIDWNGRNVCIVHVGTYNLRNLEKPSDIFLEINSLINKIREKSPKIKIVISAVIYHGNGDKVLINAVNSIFECCCKNNGCIFINGNKSINANDWETSGVYLNKNGRNKLGQMFMRTVI